MEIVYDDEKLVQVLLALSGALGSEGGVAAQRPVLVDRFLEDAIEVDIDAVRDRAGEVLVAGVMEHIEEAGIHSGDSACALPPQTLAPDVVATLEDHTRAIAASLGVIGLLNVQFAVKDSVGYVIEANPRASRTVPFVAKATGIPLAKVAARVMLGSTLAQLGDEEMLRPRVATPKWVSVKEAVLPFSRFPGVDTLLGPEMRSTGEVMGIGEDVRTRLLQEPDRRGQPAAVGRDGPVLARRPGQAGRARGGPCVRRTRHEARGDVRDGCVLGIEGPARGDGRGESRRDRRGQRRRADLLGSGPARGQYSARSRFSC